MGTLSLGKIKAILPNHQKSQTLACVMSVNLEAKPVGVFRLWVGCVALRRFQIRLASLHERDRRR